MNILFNINYFGTHGSSISLLTFAPYLKNNQNKIFESGNLAEGPWNEQLSEKIQSICKVKNAISVNSNGSGLVALLLIYKEYYGRKDTSSQEIFR